MCILGVSHFTSNPAIKEESKLSYYYTTQRGARALTGTLLSKSKGHLMPFESVSRCQTHALGWQHQEPYHCASAVATLTVLTRTFWFGFSPYMGHEQDTAGLTIS